MPTSRHKSDRRLQITIIIQSFLLSLSLFTLIVQSVLTPNQKVIMWNELSFSPLGVFFSFVHSPPFKYNMYMSKGKVFFFLSVWIRARDNVFSLIFFNHKRMKRSDWKWIQWQIVNYEQMFASIYTWNLPAIHLSVVNYKIIMTEKGPFWMCSKYQIYNSFFVYILHDGRRRRRRNRQFSFFAHTSLSTRTILSHSNLNREAVVVVQWWY